MSDAIRPQFEIDSISHQARTLFQVIEEIDRKYLPKIIEWGFDGGVTEKINQLRRRLIYEACHLALSQQQEYQKSLERQLMDCLIMKPPDPMRILRRPNDPA